jgi:hypothetical protein
VNTLVLAKQTRSLGLRARKSVSAFAVLATLATSSLIALPQANADEIFSYRVNADDSATVTGCVTTCPSDLVIPATLDGHVVTSVANDAFWAKGLNSVSLPDSVKVIGANAFRSNALAEATIPASVNSIGSMAFYNNKISSLTIPATLSVIGQGAFKKNRLTAVVAEANCPSADIDVFAENDLLQSVTVPFYAENCGDTLSGIAINRLAQVGQPASAPRIRWAVPGDSQIRLNVWRPRRNGGSVITRYEYSIDGGSSWLAVDQEPTQSQVVLTGLVNGTSYDVQLRAFNAAGGGAASSARTVTPRTKSDTPVITALTGLSAKIRVEFNEPVSNGGAQIQRYAFSVNGGAWYTWGAKNVNTTQYIRGLKPRVECTIRVRAYTAAGWGAISEEVTGKATR